jgi:hypothetical protein
MPEREFPFGEHVMRRLVDGGFIDKMVKRVVIDIEWDDYPKMYVSTTPSNPLFDELFKEPGLKVVKVEDA